MHRNLRLKSPRRLSLLAIAIALASGQGILPAQGTDVSSQTFDGGAQEVLQSIFVPFLPNAPFSLTLHTEWSRPYANGGTFTTANNRPIKRDAVGRIYQERWLLTPKGSEIPSRMNWIQIADPVAHIYYQCSPRRKVCDLKTLTDSVTTRLDPALGKSGPLQDNKGTTSHEDLGGTSFLGLPVHEYRDTTTLNPGVLGNDLPMSTVQQYRFCEQLGLNLSSTLDSPQIGRQVFTVTEVDTSEPDPSFFLPPQGYTVVDHRSPPPVE